MRNGYSPKTVASSQGDIKLDIPREHKILLLLCIILLASLLSGCANSKDAKQVVSVQPHQKSSFPKEFPYKKFGILTIHELVKRYFPSDSSKYQFEWNGEGWVCTGSMNAHELVQIQPDKGSYKEEMFLNILKKQNPNFRLAEIKDFNIILVDYAKSDNQMIALQSTIISDLNRDAQKDFVLLVVDRKDRLFAHYLFLSSKTGYFRKILLTKTTWVNDNQGVISRIMSLKEKGKAGWTESFFYAFEAEDEETTRKNVKKARKIVDEIASSRGFEITASYGDDLSGLLYGLDTFYFVDGHLINVRFVD